MSRESRIAHPPGSRYFKIRIWAVAVIGRDCAAVLSAIEFRDQYQDEPGAFCVTRAKLIADLEGLVSKNKVDAGIATLLAQGWIVSRRRSIIGEKNLQTSVEFALRPDAINAYLANVCPGNNFQQDDYSRLPQTGSPEKSKQGTPETPDRSPFGVSSIRVNKELSTTTTGGGGFFLEDEDEKDMRSVLLSEARQKGKVDVEGWADGGIRNINARGGLTEVERGKLERYRSAKRVQKAELQRTELAPPPDVEAAKIFKLRHGQFA